LGCQQTRLGVVVKKQLRRLLANRKKVNKGLSIHIGSNNFYIVLKGDVVKQLNAILEKDNDVSFTKTEGK
jgi:diaminopimelate decarboxylase